MARAVTVTAAAAMLDNHYIYHVIAAAAKSKKPSGVCEINSRRVYFRPERDNPRAALRAFLERCQSERT